MHKDAEDKHVRSAVHWKGYDAGGAVTLTEIHLLHGTPTAPFFHTQNSLYHISYVCHLSNMIDIGGIRKSDAEEIEHLGHGL